MVLLFSMVYRETFTLLLFVVGAVSSQELLTNGDFDDPTGYSNGWVCTQASASCDPSADALSGNTSIHISDRRKLWSGMYKDLAVGLLEGGKRYSIEGHIKLPETDGEATPTRTRILISYQMKRPDDSTTWKTQMLSEMYLTPGEGWVELGTDFSRLDPGVNTFVIVRLAIHVGNPGGSGPYPDFIADSFSLTEIVEDSSWKVKAEERIETHRKSNLNLKLIGGSQNPGYTNAKLMIKQTYSQFGFGSAVDAFLLEHNEAYKNAFVENFQWGNIEGDTQWRKNEYTANALTWESVDQEMQILASKGIRVRGGNVHEDRIESMNNPDFMRTAKIPDDIYRHSMRRVDDLLGRYRYRCEHWNIVNNMFTNTKNPLSQAYRSDQIYSDLHRRAKEVDYAAKLYLNEKGLLTKFSNYIQKILHGIKKMKAGGAPVDGVGVEANMANSPSTPLLVNRLNRVAKAGLPIWLNNYRYSNPDKAARASFLGDFLTAVMGEPKVSGVMLENFWDGIDGNNDTALFEGENLTPNAAGVVLRDRIAEVTSLNKEALTFNIGAGDVVVAPVQRLYHGLYEVTIVTEPEGRVVSRRSISLLSDMGDQEVNIWF